MMFASLTSTCWMSVDMTPLAVVPVYETVVSIEKAPSPSQTQLSPRYDGGKLMRVVAWF